MFSVCLAIMTIKVVGCVRSTGTASAVATGLADKISRVFGNTWHWFHYLPTFTKWREVLRIGLLGWSVLMGWWICYFYCSKPVIQGVFTWSISFMIAMITVQAMGWIGGYELFGLGLGTGDLRYKIRTHIPHEGLAV
ncbi:hypothetical protein F5Y04DRAFT_96060 [Hypomontagnella monticulosa]|nr:hypothetical protein F5Y04DRAFT_96060 [Hypomontagnella monticulosa]